MSRILLLMAVCFSAQADLYKWTDEEGNIHYSDQQMVGHARKMDIQNSYERGSGLRSGEKKLLKKIDKKQKGKRKGGKSKKRYSSYSRKSRKACLSYREKIEDINDEMRMGYSIKRGEYLKARLRRTKDRLRKYCR